MKSALLKLNATLDKYSRPYGVVLFVLGIITLLMTIFTALVWSLDVGLLLRGVLLVSLGLILTNEKEKPNAANDAGIH